MKIRIEFNQPEDDDYIEPESSFDAVEITTSHASTLKEWGWAVHDFASTAGSLFDSAKILEEAFLRCCTPELSSWKRFVADLHPGHKAELLAELMQDKTKQDKEQS